MKKIFFSVFILAMTLCLAFGSAYIIKDFDTLFNNSQIEQPVPDTPGETPEEPEEPEQKVEITDWTFYGNSLGVYKGSADVIDNIPTSYSVGETVIKTYNCYSEEDFYSLIGDDVYALLQTPPIKVTFERLNLIKEYLNYAELVYDIEILVSTYDLSDLCVFTIEEYHTTYYEGNDFQVNTVGMSTFANTTATTIILPKEFTNLGTIGLPDNVLNFVINSNSPNLEIVARGPYCRFFVPAEFYDSYVSRFEANAPLFIIEADVEPELTYSSFSDFTSSPVEASPQYSHLLAIESYKGTETNVVVPGKSDEKYIYEIRSFETSTAVESIVLPKQIDTIRFDAFKNLTSLTSLTIYCQKVIYAEKGFSIVEPELPSACNVYVPSILVDYYKEAWPTLANRIFPIGYEAPEEMPLPYVIEDGVITAYTGSETEVVIPATYSLSSAGQAVEGSDYTITEIGEEVFKKSTIETIDMSNSSILKLGNSCFYGALSLKTVILSNCLTTIGNGCFYETAIETIDMPDSVVEIDDFAFFWCSALNSVTLSNSLESLPRSCFGMCSSLTTIVLPETISSLGEGCFATSSLSSINFPDALTGLPTNCFNACDFVEIDLSDSKITTLGESCFANNELLTNIILNDSITELPKMCFYRCSALSSYEIPSTITAFGDQCFSGCSSLSSIIIPSSVRSWGNYAFANCESLSYVEISYRPSRLPTRLFSYSVNTVVFNDSSFYYDFNPDYTDYQLFKNPSVVKFKSSVDNGSNSWLNENYIKTVEGDYNVYTRIA